MNYQHGSNQDVCWNTSDKPLPGWQNEDHRQELQFWRYVDLEKQPERCGPVKLEGVNQFVYTITMQKMDFTFHPPHSTLQPKVLNELHSCGKIWMLNRFSNHRTALPKLKEKTLTIRTLSMHIEQVEVRRFDGITRCQSFGSKRIFEEKF